MLQSKLRVETARFVDAASSTPRLAAAVSVRSPDRTSAATLAGDFKPMTAPLRLIAVAFALAAALPVAAESAKPPARPTPAVVDLNPDGSVPDKIVYAGKETPVASVWDCALPTLAPVVSARVEHGGVGIRTGNAPRCGKPSMSVTEILYRSAPGFRGADTLHILGFLTNGDIDQTYTILVK
jgi:hypothetical protein